MHPFRTVDRTAAAMALLLALVVIAAPVSAQDEGAGTSPPVTELGIPQFATQAPSVPEGVSGVPSAQAVPAAGTDALPPAEPATLDATDDLAATAPAAVFDDVERGPAGEETEEQADAVPSAAPSGALPHDLSPWGMYQAADIVVKGVMIGLVIASLITWTVWIAKAFELSVAKRRLRGAIRKIVAAPNLTAAVQSFGRRGGTGGALVRAAGEEVARSLPVYDHEDAQGVKERVASRLSRIEANAGRRITLGTGVLATIGSTAPFVGLFGTVWGIMNSFIGIAESQTTNLAVVAPGIAEALLATALGLVAAIPAVMIYNAFARSIAGYKLLLADASAGVERLVSWELRRTPADRQFAQAAE